MFQDQARLPSVLPLASKYIRHWQRQEHSITKVRLHAKRRSVVSLHAARDSNCFFATHDMKLPLFLRDVARYSQILGLSPLLLAALPLKRTLITRRSPPVVGSLG